MGERRVLVVGLDGGTWNVLDPLMEKGLMPNLRALVSGGVKGLLESTMPPITPVAWSTFQTGANPGKHGIFDFSVTIDHGQHWKIANSTSIRVKTLWQYLGEGGKRIGVINVPMTFPPTPFHGYLVTGLFTPDLKADLTIL